MALTAKQKSFIDSIWPQAVEASKRTGVDPSIIVGQSALETGWGKSAPNNNYFGIKGPGGNQQTKEFLNGKWVTITDSFRGYSSMADSVKGYADFITSNPRYRDFMGAKTIEQQLSELQQSGYATDPNYAKKVGSIADTVKGYIGQASNDVKAIGDKVAAIGSSVGSGDLSGVVKGVTELLGGEPETAGDSSSDTGGGISGFLEWVKELFSANTAARGAAIVIGFILIAGAIISLTGTDKVITETAKTAAKVIL